MTVQLSTSTDMYMFVALVVLNVVVLAANGAPQAETGAKPTVRRGGTTCQFPFIYKGVSYSSCTTKDDPDGQLWCSTETDSSNNHQKGKFKHCHEGSTCQFPFIYKGVSYSSCTAKDDPDGQLWCSTETDNSNNHQKGKFKHCQEFNKASTSQQCPLHLSSKGDLIEQKYSSKCDTCYSCEDTSCGGNFDEVNCVCIYFCSVNIGTSPFCNDGKLLDDKCLQCPECPVNDCQTYNPRTCRCDIKFSCRARFRNLRTCSDPKATYIRECDMCAACPDKCQWFNTRLCKCQIATGWTGCQN